MKPLPPAKYLREIFSYDRRTGILRWAAPRPKVVVGMIAGRLHPNGYWYVKIDGQSYRNHRIIWKWMTGLTPPNDVDHRDLNRGNNRWRNLRLATRGQNQANARPRKAAGLKGTTQWPSGKWLAQIAFKNKKMSLGTYDTTEEAHAAYVAKAKQLYGEFARAA